MHFVDSRSWIWRGLGVCLLACVVSVSYPQEPRFKGWGFRLNSKKKTVPKSSEVNPATSKNARAGKAANAGGKRVAGTPGMKLGPAAGTASIPPELKELAQKAAEAITRREWSEAKRMYVEMVEKAPHNPLAYANLGVAEYQLRNFSEAEKNIKKSLSLNPTIAQNWMTLGLIQYEGGDLVLAISSLTRAVHEDPKSANAHLYLAAVTYEYGWVDAAIGELKQAVDLNPNLAEAHYNLALTYIGLTPPKVELARRHYFEAIDLGATPSSQIEKFLGNSTE